MDLGEDMLEATTLLRLMFQFHHTIPVLRKFVAPVATGLHQSGHFHRHRKQLLSMLLFDVYYVEADRPWWSLFQARDFLRSHFCSERKRVSRKWENRKIASKKKNEVRLQDADVVFTRKRAVDDDSTGPRKGLRSSSRKSDSAIVKRDVNQTKGGEKKSKKLAVGYKAPRDIVRGFICQKRTQGEKSRNQWKARVEFLERTLAALPDGGGYDASGRRRVAREQATREFLEVSPHAFGMQKYVSYEYDPSTGIVKYAGAIFTPQSPDERILFKDLRSHAENRFSDHRAIFYHIEPGRAPIGKPELEKLILTATFVQGLTSDGETHKAWRRQQAHEAALSQSAQKKRIRR